MGKLGLEDTPGDEYEPVRNIQHPDCQIEKRLKGQLQR